MTGTGARFLLSCPMHAETGPIVVHGGTCPCPFNAVWVLRGLLVLYVTVGITLVIKYLGLLALGADEIRRRVGRVR
ncbi:MAG: hypothetical protein K2R98_07455 [Gemmataceae bacterium]|nr:hypothetical protein [Gemmataceae bacterium]